jgi:two-component system chemotaxis response regulator CheB
MGPTPPAIQLLLVDHSPSSRERLRALFEVKPDIDVVGEAGTAQKAMRILDDVSPTAVLVDCDLPAPGSFALVKEMMASYRIPIVMLSKRKKDETSDLEAQALEAGAVALAVLAPEGPDSGKGNQDELVRTVRAMSEVKVVRRRERNTGEDKSAAKAAPDRSSEQTPRSRAPLVLEEPTDRIAIVAIGASTGGPQVLETILRGLAKRLTVPVLVVQHLSQGFQNNLINWLSETTGVRICVGKHGMQLSPGIVYMAPDNKHMKVNASGCLILSDDPPENGSRPSVSVLFRSVAEHHGPNAIGILLSGMGRDGAKELRLMRERGALTIAQDEETSAVYGMPGEAIKLKGARYVLPPDRITQVVGHHLPAAAADCKEAVPCR